MVLHPEVAFAADEGPQCCYYRSRSCWKVRRAAENVPPPCWCLFARAPSEATWPLCRHFDDVTHTHTHTSTEKSPPAQTHDCLQHVHLQRVITETKCTKEPTVAIVAIVL